MDIVGKTGDAGMEENITFEDTQSRIAILEKIISTFDCVSSLCKYRMVERG
jgi:hypothetical protein